MNRVVVVAVVVVAGGALAQIFLPWPPSADTTYRAVVRTVSGNSSCSGVLVERDRLLTSDHCSHTLGASVFAEGAGAIGKVVKLIANCPKRDLALFEVTDSVSYTFSGPTLATASPKKADKLVLVGYGYFKALRGWSQGRRLAASGLTLVSSCVSPDCRTEQASLVAVDDGAAACMRDSGGAIMSPAGVLVGLIAYQHVATGDTELDHYGCGHFVETTGGDLKDWVTRATNGSTTTC